MSRIFKKTSSIKLPRRSREDRNESYWHDGKGVTKCPVCGNVFFKKHWHSSEDKLASLLKVENVEIREEKICPACQTIQEKTFAGEVFVEDFPSDQIDELLNLVRNFGKKATEIDPQDRIINIEEIENGYHITTTENQLANKIAKKIKDSFNLVEVNFSHAAEPAKIERVHVKFKIL